MLLVKVTILLQKDRDLDIRSRSFCKGHRRGGVCVLRMLLVFLIIRLIVYPCRIGHIAQFKRPYCIVDKILRWDMNANLIDSNFQGGGG